MLYNIAILVVRLPPSASEGSVLKPRESAKLWRERPHHSLTSRRLVNLVVYIYDRVALAPACNLKIMVVIRSSTECGYTRCSESLDGALWGAFVLGGVFLSLKRKRLEVGSRKESQEAPPKIQATNPALCDPGSTDAGIKRITGCD